MNKKLEQLKVKIFADGADRKSMLELYENPLIKGFTTNPTLMRKAGVRSYKSFAKGIAKAIPDRPLSFEVFADDFSEMEIQAREISSWGENIYVKIPVMNTKGENSYPLIRALTEDGVKVNVTAVLTQQQVKHVHHHLRAGTPAYLSIFAGRIADTGTDPVPLMKYAVKFLGGSQTELIWASPREVLNIFQADACGVHVITVSNALLKKLALVGKDHAVFSLDTVRMFYVDAQEAGYTL